MKPPAPRLLLISYAPGGASGFGNQASILYEAATAAGWEVAVAQLCICPHECPPRIIHADGMIVTWLVETPLPAESLGLVLHEFKPDAILALCEVWQLAGLFAFPDLLARTHLWLAPDHEDVFDGAADVLERAATVVFAAKFSHRAWGAKLRRKTLHIPHGIDGTFYRPLPAAQTAAIRRALGLAGHFVAAHVGKNCWRKQQPLLVEGWSRFVLGLAPQDRGRATLILHTSPEPAPDTMGWGAGCDLVRLVGRHPAEVRATIRFSPPGARESLLALYNAADVHVLTSCGEGFGIPLAEAQACGTPNISADNTSTPEILDGWGVKVRCNSFQIQPDIVAKRPLVDVEALAAAFRSEQGRTRDTAAMRKDTLARYSRADVLAAWRKLLGEVRP